MAQLWGGRFTKQTDQMVYDFNASIRFDKRLLQQDIEGSIAHVVMLEKQGILTCEEKDAIVKGQRSGKRWRQADLTYPHSMKTCTALWRQR